MDFDFRNKMICYLAGAAISVNPGGTTNTNSELALIPEGSLVEFLDDISDEKWKDRDLVRLAELLIQDERTTVKERISELLPQIAEQDLQYRIENDFMDLAKVRHPGIRGALFRNFLPHLQHLGEMDRTGIICRWALSSDASVREMIAQAIALGVTAQIGVSSAIRYLSADGDVGVRVATVAAAETQLENNPVIYTRILHNLRFDENDTVKAAAELAAKKIKDSG